MVIKLILAFAIFSLSSCGILSKKESGLIEVQLLGTVHKPYCGGAKPSPDVEKGYYESMKFEKFHVLKGTAFTGDNELVKKIELDEAGKATLNLEPGDYLLVHADKFLSIDEFMAENGPVQPVHYNVKDKSCFQEWMKNPDLTFKVSSDTIIEMRVKAKCWVGTNPCIEYVGPPAP